MVIGASLKIFLKFHLPNLEFLSCNEGKGDQALNDATYRYHR